MTNSHTNSRTDGDTWHPLKPPRRGADSIAFHAYLLLPGLSDAFHAETLNRSRSSIANYRAKARHAASVDQNVGVAIDGMIRAMRAEDGLEMARRRGRSHLPHWSRLAIKEFRKRGMLRNDIAEAFRCSPSTIANVLQGKAAGYRLGSGERLLTASQKRPPARFQLADAERT